jgi:beta-N-acetylhexosaminidase
VSSRPSSSPGGSCADLVESLTVDERVGQLFMLGVNSAGLTSRAERVLSDGQIGAVIFLGNSTAGASSVERLVRDVRTAAKTPADVRTMLTVDQEGGQVQRLRGPGFDRIPSARQQVDLSDADLASDARTWGEQLKKVGIDADLAPVADVVPKSFEAVNQPIGQLDRGYGPDVDVVADKVTAFVRGMDAAGIATSVKHFPGLGKVRGNTDFVKHVVDDSTTRRDADLRGFSAGVRADVDMVMISSAYYERIDPDRRAAFSPTVIETMLRGDLGFEGVVISDDLAAEAVSDLSPGQRALRFLRAGGDLVIVGNPGLAPDMVDAVRDEARSDPDFARAVTDKASRVVAMKARRGLADCG